MLTAVSGRYTNTVGYAFDPVGRKASESLTISGKTYTIGTEYNSRNELIQYTYPDGSTADRTYHASGALNQLKLDGSTISTRSYDDGRRMTSEVLGNGIAESRTYRNDNLLSTISYSNTNIGNLGYSWDANKNKTAETISGAMSGYGFTSSGTVYDDEDRLTGYQRASGSLNQSWALTSVGDWSSTTINGTAQSRTHGPTHELLTASGQSVTTDVKGNTTVLPSSLTSPASSLALGYDFDNKMKLVDIDNDSSTDVNFQYDALGRRVARVGSSGSIVYVQADQQTIADYGVGDAPSSPLYRYVYASYIDEPVVRKGAGSSGTIYYYHRNQQYSIYAITDSAGAVSERYAYTAYGQPTILAANGTTTLTTSAVNNRYTYTAREWDMTIGLHHFRARWMSGLTGRFLTRDPMRYISGRNMCSSYMGLVKLDPLGMYADDPKPPYPSATGPDKETGCYEMKFQDLMDLIANGGVLPEIYNLALTNGCSGIVRCGQMGGTCPDDGDKGLGDFPEIAPNTKCFKVQRSTDPLIPKGVEDAKCGEGEEKFVFAKQGSEIKNRCWNLEGDWYEPGKFGPDTYPPVVGSYPTPGIPHPDSGVFNYIWYVNGWYVWVDHFHSVKDPATVSICPKPLIKPKYPVTMWCYTCKKKCKDSKYPEIPQPIGR